MSQIRIGDVLLIVSTIVVLVACTVLALLQGYMMYRKAPLLHRSFEDEYIDEARDVRHEGKAVGPEYVNEPEWQGIEDSSSWKPPATRRPPVQKTPFPTPAWTYKRTTRAPPRPPLPPPPPPPPLPPPRQAYVDYPEAETTEYSRTYPDLSESYPEYYPVGPYPDEGFDIDSYSPSEGERKPDAVPEPLEGGGPLEPEGEPPEDTESPEYAELEETAPAEEPEPVAPAEKIKPLAKQPVVDCECPPLEDTCPAPVAQKKLFSGESAVRGPSSGKVRSQYPFLVSLQEPMYSDSEAEWRYACSGAIVDARHVLTGLCLAADADQADWLRLQVRSASDYWSKDGDVHRVTEVSQPRFRLGGLHLLSVEPPFALDVPLEPFGVRAHAIQVRDSPEPWKEATAVGWYKDPMNTKKLNEPEEKLVMYAEVSAADDEPPTSTTIACDDSDVGHPLVLGTDGTLVGMSTGRGCLRDTRLRMHRYRFTDLTSALYNRWLLEVQGRAPTNDTAAR